jgi:hypothetical protein
VPYGSGDFLGGMATRRAHVLTVLVLARTAGALRWLQRVGLGLAAIGILLVAA